MVGTSLDNGGAGANLFSADDKLDIEVSIPRTPLIETASTPQNFSFSKNDNPFKYSISLKNNQVVHSKYTHGDTEYLYSHTAADERIYQITKGKEIYKITHAINSQSVTVVENNKQVLKGSYNASSDTISVN